MTHKSTLTRLLLAAFVGLFALSACATPVGGGSTSEQPHTISVTGNGVSYGKPDIAIASIGVQTRNVDPGQAVTQNNDKMEAIVAALKELGIEEKDIQTTNFSVYVQQNYDSQGKPTEFTYVADNTVTVTVRDLNKVGDALGRGFLFSHDRGWASRAGGFRCSQRMGDGEKCQGWDSRDSGGRIFI